MHECYTKIFKNPEKNEAGLYPVVYLKISLCKFINQILEFFFCLIRIILNKPRVGGAYLINIGKKYLSDYNLLG
ncbi:hypothetical protein ASG33_01465 [Dyadobacter sp. Leaf189]|nr:hypothetical protein ASG33_01465 [Dyadobacter sp. Leaf189]